jgi:hypothetical protein
MIRIALIISVGFAALGCASINAQLDEGSAYGRSHDLGECYEEALNRFSSCDGSYCEAVASGFGRGCASTASYSEEFCTSLPDSVWGLVGWLDQQCSAHDHPGSEACRKAIQQPATACHDRFAS